MSILSREKIIEEWKKGNIKITVDDEDVFDEENIGAASYDLSLGDEFRLFVNGRGVVDMNESVDFKDFTRRIKVNENERFILPSHQTCLGITKEQVELSDTLCGLLEGRSRFARMGLFVHITAGFIQPGIKNKQVLEIYNASPNPIALIPGTRVCQFVFMRMDGKAKYKGKYIENEL